VQHSPDRGVPDVYVFRYPQPPSVQLDDPKGAETKAQWERLKGFFETWFRTPSRPVQGGVPALRLNRRF
jgi:hypothetical protein